MGQAFDAAMEDAEGRAVAAGDVLLGEAQPAGERSAGFADPAANDPVAPVSYTHLRAHETVLDLVCRLLLEKKRQM